MGLARTATAPNRASQREAGSSRSSLVERTAHGCSGGLAALRGVLDDVGLAKVLERRSRRVAVCPAAAVEVTGGYGSVRANAAGCDPSLHAGAGVGGCLAFAASHGRGAVAPRLSLAVEPVPAAVAAIASPVARMILRAGTGEPWSVALTASIAAVAGTAGERAIAHRGARDRLRRRGRGLPVRARAP